MRIQFARGKDFIDLFSYKFQSEYNITNKSKSIRVVIAKGNMENMSTPLRFEKTRYIYIASTLSSG